MTCGESLRGAFAARVPAGGFFMPTSPRPVTRRNLQSKLQPAHKVGAIF